MNDDDKIIPEDIWSQESVKQEILAQVKAIAEVLIEKNKKYGNSAIQPKRIFSRASTVEQINVRIDDKLSRIANQQVNEDEDAEFDLIGYLILKRVFNNLMQKDNNKTKTVING
jgi:predicted ATPase with chaperone activity